MKKFAYILFCLVVAACGSTQTDDSKAEKLREKLKALKKTYTETKAEIEEIEIELASLEKKGPKDGLRLVESLRLSPQLFEHYFEVQGNVKSQKNVLVVPESQGVILERLVEEGQAVSKGQVLARLDNELIRRNLEQVEKSYELAKELFVKQENLYKQKIGTEVQYLQAKNNKESLEKNIELLRTQLNKSNIVSPIDGVVDEIFQNKGEMAIMGNPFARVVDLSSVEVTAEIAENYLRQVKKGDSVKVSFPAINLEMPVRIERVGQFINPENRTFKISMKIQNNDNLLKPNTLALLKIRDFQKRNAVVVPSQYIQKSTSGQKFIYILIQEGDADVVKKVAISTGMTYREMTMIESGLQADAVIVTKGYSEVINGEKVNVMNALSLN
jgi:RND family efflux transporter MFP subunit